MHCNSHSTHSLHVVMLISPVAGSLPTSRRSSSLGTRVMPPATQQASRVLVNISLAQRACLLFSRDCRHNRQTAAAQRMICQHTYTGTVFRLACIALMVVLIECYHTALYMLFDNLQVVLCSLMPLQRTTHTLLHTFCGRHTTLSWKSHAYLHCSNVVVQEP